MTATRLLPFLCRAIGLLTIVSGAVQVVAPAFVLSLVGGDASPPSRHFFGIVGMFMVLFGGALVHGLAGPAPDRVVLLWTGLQKLGASAAVGLGVARGLFAPLALAVAGFDFASGVVIFLLRARAARAGE